MTAIYVAYKRLRNYLVGHGDPLQLHQLGMQDLCIDAVTQPHPQLLGSMSSKTLISALNERRLGHECA